MYLEVEPAESSLTSIQGASPVKAQAPTLSLSELKVMMDERVQAGLSLAVGDENMFKPLLAHLLPVGALRAVEETKSRVLLYADAKEVGKKATRDARQHLAAVGLPGSIADSANDGGISENLWARLTKAQELGVSDWLMKSKLQELDQGAERVHEIMNKIKKGLNDEKSKATLFMHAHPGVTIGNGEDDEQFRKDLEHYVEVGF